MFFVVLTAAVVLNVKILRWWKPVAVTLGITLAVFVATQVYMSTYTGNILINEVSGAISSALNLNARSAGEAGSQAQTAAQGAANRLDYFINDGDTLIFSVNGEEAVVTANYENPNDLKVSDADGGQLALTQTAIQFSQEEGAAPNPAFLIEDPRFSAVQLIPASMGGEEGAERVNMFLFQLADSDKSWAFTVREDGTYYYNELGNEVKLSKVPAIGWSDNLSFGSGRGYIWSRTLPMIAETVFVGRGADTYALYYPHNDYVGKYNAGWNINTIVDKPHNMYMGAAVGTGLISVIALVALYVMYIVQSVRIYMREEFNDFISIVGVGILFGVVGFAVAGFVDDSSVSVMPLFYGLMGVGAAINMMLARRRRAAEAQKA
jgi:hypothetical protein